jgi:hypothetical protein
VCSEDCIAYWDSKYLPEKYRHAHRSSCPRCGADRYVQDPRDGSFRAVRVLFFFPIAPFVKSLFGRPDLVPFLYHDTEDGRPVGHVTRSRGFKHKVLDNPRMNGDQRNLGMVGTTDGVPFFEDQNRGGWCFVNRVANFPDTLSQHMANVHLHMVAASEYWELDADAGVLRRRVRSPKSLMPHMSILVDDYRAAYIEGVHT